MKKIIPQQEIVTCDCCKKRCGEEVSRLQNGALIIKRDALDWSNIPVADGSTSLDLCDSCLHHICTSINAAVAVLTTP